MAFLFTTSACGDESTSSGDPSATGGTASAAAWSSCFAPTDDIDTCDAYCAEQDLGCATTCATGASMESSQPAASLTWDGPDCSCGNPRCPAADRATGWSEACNAVGFATEGNAFPRTSVQCCCQAGAASPEPPACDELTQGVWIKQPVPSPMCATDGLDGYDELNFEPPQPDVGAWTVQWSCFNGDLVSRSAGVYELDEDRCSGSVFGAHFTVVGDMLTLSTASGGARSYKHAPDAPKRPGNPALGT